MITTRIIFGAIVLLYFFLLYYYWDQEDENKAEDKPIEKEKEDGRKKLVIDKTIMSSLLISFPLSLFLMVVIQHFGKIYSREFSSPLGYDLSFGEFIDSSYYFTKLEIYLSASLAGFPYLILFCVIITAIVYFFKKYKLTIK